MSNANQLELDLLVLINAERAAVGLAPLRLITVLNDAAESHSAWMLQTDNFSHTGAGGTSPSDRMADAGYPFQGRTMALENIGWQSERGPDGAADDVTQIHEGLMASDGHRANILNPEVTDIGIGVETGTFSTPGGDFEAVMVTQVFGKTDGDVSGLIDPGNGASAPADDVVDDPVTDEPEEDAGDDVPDTPVDPVDDTDIPDTPDVVADVDDPEEPDTDTPDHEGDDTGDDTNADDDDTVDSPDGDGDMPMIADMPLPCGLDRFEVDLSSAFDIRKEGDQWIWETTEDRLVEAFLASFDDWANGDMPPDYDVDLVADDAEMDIAEIVPSEDALAMADQVASQNENAEDDWLMDSCV